MAPGIYEYRAVFLYTGMDAWSQMMQTEEVLFKQVFLTEFFPYSPTVEYDLEGLSVLYCIVHYSGYYRYLPERN